MLLRSEIIAEYGSICFDTQYLNNYIENYKRGYKDGKKCSGRKLAKQFIVHLAYTSGKEKGMRIKLENRRSRQRSKVFAKMREADSAIRFVELGTN